MPQIQGLQYSMLVVFFFFFGVTHGQTSTLDLSIDTKDQMLRAVVDKVLHIFI